MTYFFKYMIVIVYSFSLKSDSHVPKEMGFFASVSFKNDK